MVVSLNVGHHAGAVIDLTPPFPQVIADADISRKANVDSEAGAVELSKIQEQYISRVYSSRRPTKSYENKKNQEIGRAAQENREKSEIPGNQPNRKQGWCVLLRRQPKEAGLGLSLPAGPFGLGSWSLGLGPPLPFLGLEMDEVAKWWAERRGIQHGMVWSPPAPLDWILISSIGLVAGGPQGTTQRAHFCLLLVLLLHGSHVRKRSAVTGAGGREGWWRVGERRPSGWGRMICD